MSTGLLTEIYAEMRALTVQNLSVTTPPDEDIFNARGVYGLHNRKTGAIYIGSTNRTLRGRILEHRNALDEKRHDNWRMMEEYDPTEMEVRVFSFTNDDNIPEYVIEVLEQIAISAFPLDILYNQNIVYPKARQIAYIRGNHKDLLYSLVQKLRDLYAWQVNQCMTYKKPARMLLSTIVLGGDLKLLDVEPGTLLTTI